MHQLYQIQPTFRILGYYSAYDFNWDSKFDFKGESHDFWELALVLSGQVEAVSDDSTFLLGEGNMICHEPNEFHRIKSAGNTCPHVLILSFAHDGELPQALRKGVFSLPFETVQEYTLLFGMIRPFVRAMVKQQNVQAEELRAAAEEGTRRLEAFLFALSHLETAKKLLSHSAGAEEYRKLVRMMTERAADNLSLEEIAELRHISPSYVKKLFHTFAGEGPMSYYARLRVREIRRLLEEGFSVAQVSEHMNFSSPSYLSLFFKKQTGINPSKYRERNRL